MILPVVLSLTGCTAAQVASNANQEANRLWAGWVAYDAEQWIVRREMRRICLEKVIHPGIEQLVEQDRFAEAVRIMAANYPPVTFADVFDDDSRGGLLDALDDMPACEWPEDITLSPLASVP